MRKESNEEGIYVVVAAITAAVCVALLALVLDTGRTFNSNLQLRSAAGLAAKAAVRKFAEETGTYAQREAEALITANAIYKDNLLVGNPGYIHPDLGIPGAPDDGGELILGFWADDDQYCGTPPCPNICPGVLGYPCFVPRDPSDPDPRINAAQVRAQTAANQGIPGIFSNILGVSSFDLEETQTAKIVSRCTHLLVDLSTSLVRQTHDNSLVNLGNPTLDPKSLYAIPEDWITQGAAFCPPLRTPLSAEEVIFCDMVANRPIRTAASPVGPEIHYLSDYTDSVVTLSGATYRLDSFRFPGYDGPQPLRSVMLGLNRAVTAMINQSILGDQVGMIAFDSNTNTRRTIPLSNNLELIQQVTNMDNLATFTSGGPVLPVSPNMRDLEMFPTVTGFTNVIGAIDQAITDIDRSCTEDSVKSIVVVTDGIINCYNFRFDPTGNNNVTGCGTNEPCMTAQGTYTVDEPNGGPGTEDYYIFCNGTRYRAYDNSRFWHLNGWFRHGGASQTQEAMLQTRGITLNMIMIGDHAGVHTMNRRNTSVPINSEHAWYTVEELVALGQWNQAVRGRSWSENWDEYVGGTTGTPFDSNYRPFRDANDLWWRIVYGTGGKWAPIRPAPPAANCIPAPWNSSLTIYDPNLRSNGQPLYFDPQCRTLEQQAGDYGIDILGVLPNTLVAAPLY